MDWILNNIWVLVAIATVIARLLMKRNQGDAASGGQPAAPKEYEFKDPELAERTRKIREEIQRKIAERRGQHLQPPVLPPEEPRPVPIERSPEATTPPLTLPEIFREVMQPAPPPLLRRTVAVNLAEEAERQKALVEKLEAAEAMKVAAQRRAALAQAAADRALAALPPVRTGLLDDLGSPQALRRAFVLREVLGPPVALR